MPSEEQKALDRELKLNQVYLAIISRYKDVIEEREHLSVAELPTLVKPKDERILRKAEEIKSSFGIFSYKQNFYEASIDAFYFVRNNIADAAMPVQFWLAPEETMSFGIGDLLDRNVLLCSLLIALGNPSTKVLVVIRDGGRKVLTYYEFEGKAYSFDLLDLSHGFKSHESREEMIRRLGLVEEDTAYEFNDNTYQDIA
jgi:hypothetical protein